MRPWLLAVLFLCGSLPGLCDDTSGPGRATLLATPWGSFYYEPNRAGSYQLDTGVSGFRFSSAQGQVTMEGSEASGYRLASGGDSLVIHVDVEDLEIRWKDRRWALQARLGKVTLTSTAPKDAVVFDRSSNTCTIRGARGEVQLATEFGNVTVKGPQGTTTITNDNGRRSLSGPPLDQVPYLGRGLFILFHGVGVFVDVTRRFPMPEVTEWVEWRPILE